MAARARRTRKQSDHGGHTPGGGSKDHGTYVIVTIGPIGPIPRLRKRGSPRARKPTRAELRKILIAAAKTL